MQEGQDFKLVNWIDSYKSIYDFAAGVFIRSQFIERLVI